jgi:opacity protein-like surface antigen
MQRGRARACALVMACVAARVAWATDLAEQSSAKPFNWTGFYVGAQLGGLANLSEVSDPLGPSLFGNPNLATGAFAGGQLGYNYQVGNWVYGFEADANFSEGTGTSTCSSVSGSFMNSNCQVGIDAFGSLAARLGLTIGPQGRTLLYGKAGAAWWAGDIELATNDWSQGIYSNPYTSGGSRLMHWGWMLGGGAEHALSGRWSVKAEYAYAHFVDEAVPLLPSAYLDDFGNILQSVPARDGGISSAQQTFKIGLNYNFGRSDEPAHATPSNAAGGSGPLDRIGLDVGGRYWYSWGRHRYDLGNVKNPPFFPLLNNPPVIPLSLMSRLTFDNLQASTGEAYGRLTLPWNLFAKGFVGGGTISGGNLNDEDFGIEGVVNMLPYSNTYSVVSGDIPRYFTIDGGYDFWRAPGYRFGAFIGYNHFEESMGAYTCLQLTNQMGPCSPAEGGPLLSRAHVGITENATWRSVRLGAAGEFYLVPGLKLTVDAAYLPYMHVESVDHHFFAETGELDSISAQDGRGTGAQLEAMIAYDITDRLSLGLGGRYWAMWTQSASDQMIYDRNWPLTFRPQFLRLETERIGVLLEASYKLD